MNLHSADKKIMNSHKHKSLVVLVYDFFSDRKQTVLQNIINKSEKFRKLLTLVIHFPKELIGAHKQADEIIQACK